MADIPVKFWEGVRRRITDKAVKGSFNKECWQWTGPLRKDRRYGQFSMTILGDRLRVNAHRAAYMAFNQILDLPNDISHLCHEGHCVNPEHLYHEDRVVNLERNSCKESGECKGHIFNNDTYPACIF